jgi:hypothetical protein
MDEIENVMQKHLGRICKCRDKYGHQWASKLIKIVDGICYFEIKDGRIVGNLLEDIVQVIPLGAFSPGSIMVDDKHTGNA